MRRFFGLAGMAGGLLVAWSASAAPCHLADLAWMAGAWRSDDATTRSEERWTVGPGDRLMGSSWLLHTDRPGGVIEAETIQADGEAVSLRIRHFSADLAKAREDKEAPMVFLASDCAAKSLVLDGQGAQAGERMIYRRAGDKISFEGDFLHDGKPLKVTITFVKARE